MRFILATANLLFAAFVVWAMIDTVWMYSVYWTDVPFSQSYDTVATMLLVLALSLANAFWMVKRKQ